MTDQPPQKSRVLSEIEVWMALHNRVRQLEAALRDLVAWGYGENAPDMAKRSWEEADRVLDGQ